MRRGKSISSLLLLLVLFMSSAAAEPPEVELKFALGLTRLGYFDLAAERLKLLDWQGQEDHDLRRQVAEGLVDNYMAASRRAGRAGRRDGSVEESFAFLSLAFRVSPEITSSRRTLIEDNRDCLLLDLFRTTVGRDRGAAVASAWHR